MKNHAKASTFAIRTSQPHKAKIAKELALPTHHDTTKMDRQTTYREEGRTANKGNCCTTPFFLENSFQKHIF